LITAKDELGVEVTDNISPDASSIDNAVSIERESTICKLLSVLFEAATDECVGEEPSLDSVSEWIRNPEQGRIKEHPSPSARDRAAAAAVRKDRE